MPLVFLKQGRLSKNLTVSGPAKLGTQSRAEGSGQWPLRITRIMSRRAGDRILFLRASRDIEFVKQHGRRLSTACFNLLVCKTEGGTSRVGIIVGRRFGIAVRRNRVKRLFRELTRQIRNDLTSNHALLVFPKRDALTLPFQELNGLWRATLRRQGLLGRREA